MKDELLKLNLLASSIRCNRDRRLFFFFLVAVSMALSFFDPRGSHRRLSKPPM